MLSWDLEESLWAEGYQNVCGTDEAGRGPLAGPVVAAAVILNPANEIPGLNDSKKLSEKKREQLFECICQTANTYAVGMASPEEIDELNILNASMLAMHRAVKALSPAADYVLIDGNVSRGFDYVDHLTVIKGDAKSPSIAAASILAKVTRDRIMVQLDQQYPQYEFAKHKGYPTRRHMELVRKYGIIPDYRKSFLKFLQKENSK